MINCEQLRKELEEKFLGFFPEKSDLEKLEKKIELSEPVIHDLEISIKHAYGIHQILLEWNMEHYKEIKLKAEISLEILQEKYKKFN